MPSAQLASEWMRFLELLTNRPQTVDELRLERLRSVTLQQLAQIPVDARIQVGVGPAGAVQGHVGSEIAALPQMLAAMRNSMWLRQVVAARADGACEIERE